MEIWQLILIIIVLFILINFVFKTAKFILKLIMALIIAGVIYYLLR
ncbi:MAG: hypothetical protein AABW45_01710 [Nanoarchaeota archaeon]